MTCRRKVTILSMIKLSSMRSFGCADATYLSLTSLKAADNVEPSYLKSSTLIPTYDSI